MVVFDASVLIDLFNKRLKGDRRMRLDPPALAGGCLVLPAFKPQAAL